MSRKDHSLLTPAERRRLEEIENVHRALRQAAEFMSDERNRITSRAAQRIRYEEAKQRRPKEPPRLIPYAGKE